MAPSVAVSVVLKVNRLFATEDTYEQHDAQVSADETYDGTYDPRHPAHTRHILIIPINELLKHLDVITFIGDLVQEIPKHRIGIA